MLNVQVKRPKLYFLEKHTSIIFVLFYNFEKYCFTACTKTKNELKTNAT